jgi:tRNA U55 pseudouridine synthase TruB
LPIDSALQAIPSVTVDRETARRIAFGQDVAIEAPRWSQLRVYDGEDQLLAIMRPRADDVTWRPHKVFVPS